MLPPARMCVCSCAHRALLLVGPAGCGKSHAAAAALAAALAAEEEQEQQQHPQQPQPPPQSQPAKLGPEQQPQYTSSGRKGRRRPVAAHFCRAGDGASQDAGAALRSLAFQLACGSAHGSKSGVGLGPYLRTKYLGG